MFKVYNDGSVELTRGDSAHLAVTITNDVDGSVYEIQPDDTLTLSMKKYVNDESPCLQKTIKGSNTFHLKPDDTRGLNFGKYKYDVQLTTAEGDVYTVLGPETFELLSEVTC